MPRNRNENTSLLQFRKKSTLLIKETLYEINTGMFDELGRGESNLYNLIAEFAATFSIRKWAAKRNWRIRKGYFRISNVSFEDMKAIADAQKAGAVFSKIKVGSRNSGDRAVVYFHERFEFQLEPTSLEIDSICSDRLMRIVIEALKSGLELKLLEIGWYHTSKRLFFQELTTKVRIKEIKLKGYPLDVQDLRLILSKFKSGNELQSVEFLDLSGTHIGNKHAELIAESLRAGIMLKRLNVSDNWIVSKGAIPIIEAIQMGVGLNYLDLRDNYIKSKDFAAFRVAEDTGCNIVYQ